jgi:hypothetical protein
MIESITQADEIPNRSGRTFLVGLLIALILTAGVGLGMIALQRRNAAKLAEQQAKANAAKPEATSRPTPELQVFLDDAIVKAGQASLSGTIKNISPGPIAGIKVDLQLYRRQGDKVEVRSLSPEPADLSPNGEAKYHFSVPQKEFRTLRVLRVTSNANPGREIAFVTAPGARRPLEGPATVTTTVNGSRPGKGKDGDVFINTPDTPIKIP